MSGAVIRFLKTYNNNAVPFEHLKKTLILRTFLPNDKNGSVLL